MGSYFGYGNYSDYGTQGNWGVNKQTNPYSGDPLMADDIPLFATRPQHTAPPEEKKEGGIAGFFKGIVKGAVNSVKSLFTPQGLLMAAAVMGLVFVTGGAIIPLLAVMGMGMGGMQMMKGAQDGDTEAMGEGFFTFGSSALGLKATPSPVTIGKGAAAENYTLTGSKAGQSAGFLDQLKAPFGFSKYKSSTTGESVNMYSLAWRKARNRFSAQPQEAGLTGLKSSGKTNSGLANADDGAAPVSEQAKTGLKTETETSIKATQKHQEATRMRQQHEELRLKTEQAKLDQQAKLKAEQLKLEQQAKLKAEQAKQKPSLPPQPNEFGVSNRSLEVTKLPNGRTQLAHSDTSSHFVMVDNTPVPRNAMVEIKPGNIVQMDNRLFKVGTKGEIVKISDDAALVHELFPNGVNNVHFQQGQIGDCSKLSQLKALIDDPSGQGTRAVLGRISRNGDGGYQVNFVNGKTINLKGNKFYKSQDGNVHFAMKNPEQARAVKGDLGVQVIERAYYRHLKEEFMPHKTMQVPNPNHHPLFGGPAMVEARRPKTMSEPIFKLDKNYSDDFSVKLLGDEWKPVTADGYSNFGMPRISYGPASLAERQQLANYYQDPKFRPQMDQLFRQIETSPESMRVSAYTRGFGSDRVQLPLSDGRTLFGTHSYYLKGISRDMNGNRVFNVVNPHDTRITMPLSEADFMNNFNMVNGVRYQGFGMA